jgi:hypothetical protein
MTNKIAIILKEIDDILLILEKPLTNTEKKNGWTKESKKGLTGFFKNLKNQISEKNEITEAAKKTSIIRGFDSWGINKGEIFNKAIQISDLIWEEQLPRR